MSTTSGARGNDFSFRAVLAAIPDLVWVVDRDGRVVFANDAFLRYAGQDARGVLGLPHAQFIHPADADLVFDGPQGGVAAEWLGRVRRADGRYRYHLGRGAELADDGGGWVVVAHDVHERRRERLTHRFLSDLAGVLAISLDPRAILDLVTRACVPEIADQAAVYLETAGGALQLAAIATTDAAETARRAALAERFPIRAADPIARVAAAGLSFFEPVVEDDEKRLEMALGDPEVAARLRAVGLHSCIAVPIRSRGANVGVLAIMYDGDRRYDGRDVLVAEAVAGRTAVAYDNALRYEREHRVAESFQKAALPPVLPAIPGTFLSATYEAGRNEALVGGDWYDAFRLPDGRLVLSIGDVAGSGLDAAVTMGSVRQCIRTAALLDPEPAAVLDAADRIVRDIDRNRFVTAFVAVFDPIGGRMRFANAGHPPALLRTPAGEIELLHEPGLPLGLRERDDRTDSSCDLLPGSLLLLYTDGITELEHRPLDGEQRLCAALGSAAPEQLTARALYDAVASERTHRDDVAVLLMWYETALCAVADPHRAWRWCFDSADAVAARRAREALLEHAERSEAGTANAGSLVVVVAELLGNVVRHAPGPVELWLDLSGESAVVHVLDRGPGFDLRTQLPADPLAEGGRGLFVVASLTDQLSSTPRLAGGSHVRAVARRAAPW